MQIGRDSKYHEHFIDFLISLFDAYTYNYIMYI